MDIEELRALFDMAHKDKYYSDLIVRYQELESEVSDITQQLTKTEQDIIWKFVCLSDEMNIRIIELLYEKFDLDIVYDEERQ